MCLRDGVRKFLAIISGADFDEESATIATKKAIAHALNEPDFQMAKAQINAANDIIKSCLLYTSRCV